jgi:hypothetical protein
MIKSIIFYSVLCLISFNLMGQNVPLKTELIQAPKYKLDSLIGFQCDETTNQWMVSSKVSYYYSE